MASIGKATAAIGRKVELRFVPAVRRNEPLRFHPAVQHDINVNSRIAPCPIVYYNPAMQTLVLRIPDDLARELEAEARGCDLTKSEIARRRLIAAGAQNTRTTSGFDLIADLIGTVEGGPTDMSARKKHYLKTQGYGKSRLPQ